MTPSINPAALILASLLCGQAAPVRSADRAVSQGVDVAGIARPAAVPHGDRSTLRYELRVTNFANSPIEIISVTAVADGAEVARIEGAALIRALSRLGTSAAPPQVLEPGRQAIVYLDVDVPLVPRELAHAIAVRPIGGNQAIEVPGPTLSVDRAPVAELGPPLLGGPWTAVYAPEIERGHRRVVYAVAGAAHIPGRYAIDWMPAGASADGASSMARIRNNGLGATVLSVADATVVAVSDDVPEPDPSRARPEPTLAGAAGNTVILSIGRGRYAFYEHLAPGIMVRPGQAVTKGQPIGRVGSTGSASRPHLHFHVADAADALDAEGLPFRITGMKTIGSYASISAFNADRPWAARSAEPSSFPGPNAVVRFDR